jgi:zinc D-Ala-D-Ala carboxypeptidase
MKRRLGQFFTLTEMMRSSVAERLGLDNTPPPAAQANLEQLVAVVLDPLRARVGREVHIKSGYRAYAVNRAVKGSPTSQHMAGEAVDIKVDGLTGVELATVIVGLGVPFDQVIWYDPERGGHVHVSYTTTRANRGETLRAPAAGDYLPWTPASPARV